MTQTYNNRLTIHYILNFAATLPRHEYNSVCIETPTKFDLSSYPLQPATFQHPFNTLPSRRFTEHLRNCRYMASTISKDCESAMDRQPERNPIIEGAGGSTGGSHIGPRMTHLLPIYPFIIHMANLAPIALLHLPMTLAQGLSRGDVYNGSSCDT